MNVLFPFCVLFFILRFLFFVFVFVFVVVFVFVFLFLFLFCFFIAFVMFVFPSGKKIKLCFFSLNGYPFFCAEDVWLSIPWTLQNICTPDTFWSGAFILEYLTVKNRFRVIPHGENDTWKCGTNAIFGFWNIGNF